MASIVNKVAEVFNPGRDETNRMLYGTGEGSHFPHDNHMPGEFPADGISPPPNESAQLGEPKTTLDSTVSDPSRSHGQTAHTSNIASTSHTTPLSGAAATSSTAADPTSSAAQHDTIQRLKPGATVADDASTASIKSGYVGFPQNTTVSTPSEAPSAVQGDIQQPGLYDKPTPGTSATHPAQEHHYGRDAALGAGAVGAGAAAASAYSHHHNSQAPQSSTYDYGATPIDEKDFGTAVISSHTTTARSHPLGHSGTAVPQQQNLEQYGTADIAQDPTTARSFRVGGPETHAPAAAAPVSAAAAENPAYKNAVFNSTQNTAAPTQSHDPQAAAAGAALGGAALGGSAAYGAHLAGQDKTGQEKTGPVHKSEVLNKLDPRVKSHETATTDAHAGQAGHTTGVAPTHSHSAETADVQRSTVTKPAKQSHFKEDDKEHHDGRNAALAGAGGVAAYEASKHHHEHGAEDKEKKKGGLLSRLTGRHKDESASDATYVAPHGTAVDKMGTEPQQRESDHHKGAAAAAGATGAGVLGYEAAKHHKHHDADNTTAVPVQNRVEPVPEQTQREHHHHHHEKSHEKDHKHDHEHKHKEHKHKETVVAPVEHKHHDKHDKRDDYVEDDKHHNKAALGAAAGTGVAAHELSKKSSEDDSTTSGEKKQGFLSKLVHGKRGEEHGLPGDTHNKSAIQEQETEKKSDEHHYGRDAALAGGAGTAAYAAHHHHEKEQGLEQTQTPERKESLLHRLTHRKKSPDSKEHHEKTHHHKEHDTEHHKGHHAGVAGTHHHHDRHTQEGNELQPTESHASRNAALVGAGAGVGGLAAYEAHTHGEPRETSHLPTAVDAERPTGLAPAAVDYGNTVPQPVGSLAGQPTGPQHTTSEHQHQYARDAALGAGTGLAAAGGYEAVKHHHEHPTEGAGTHIDDPALKSTGAQYPHPAAGPGNDVGYGMAASQPEGGIEGTPASAQALQSMMQQRDEERHVHKSKILNKLDPRVKEPQIERKEQRDEEFKEHHADRKDAEALGGAAALAHHEHRKDPHNEPIEHDPRANPTALGDRSVLDEHNARKHHEPGLDKTTTGTTATTTSSSGEEDEHGQKKKKHRLSALFHRDHSKTDPESDPKHHGEPGFQTQQREFREHEEEHHKAGKLRKPPPEGWFDRNEPQAPPSGSAV